MYCILQSLFQMFLRFVSKAKIKYVCLAAILIVVLDFSGAFIHIFETTFDDTFSYPYNGDVHEFVAQLRHNEIPEVKPINEYNYSYIHESKDKCVEHEYPNLRIVFLVKSSVENFERRIGIRNSWGFEKRFSDVPMRTVFLLGTHPDDAGMEARIKAEAARYNDIIQADFIDAYFNNTIKTMMGFKWAVKNCGNSKFYMFVDDDMYVSVKNVLAFLRNPTNYPDYLKETRKVKEHRREIRQSGMLHKLSNPEKSQVNPEMLHGHIMDYRRQKRATAKEKIMLRRRPGWTSHNKTKFPAAKIKEDTVNLYKAPVYESKSMTSIIKRPKRQVFDFELPDDVRLLTGFVFVSAPHRHKLSKWYITLEEYPYHLWPPYVSAGAYILSREALLDMYYTSLYTKHFRFDDIFLAFVAKKADIEPFHCDEIYFYKKDYIKTNYKYVIASHGYGDPKELLKVWNEQKAMGNA